MMQIVLGVVDVPYTGISSRRMVAKRAAPRRRRGAGAPSASNVTTGQVADWLEERYGITQFFIDQHGEEFIEGILEGHVMNLTRPKTGVGSRTNHLRRALHTAEDMFRLMLMQREMDGMIDGVPTQASILGIRRGRSRNPGRPSFVDTGLYRDSFRMDFEEDV